MVNNEARQFSIYVLSQVLPQMVGLTSDHYSILQRLAGIGALPNFDIGAYKNRQITPNEWQTVLAPKIAEYFVSTFDASPKLKATA